MADPRDQAVPGVGDSLLVVRDLVAGYVNGVDIVRGASLTVAEREIVCILGPNGAGKSTFLRAVFGLLTVTGGAVELAGRSLVGVPPHRMVTHGVGYVPQTRDVFPALTVAQNLQVGATSLRAGRREALDRVLSWFPVLAERRSALAGSLSGGQRRLVGIGRALMSNPRLLLLDEPSAGLSPANVQEVFGRIDDVRRDGVAIAMVEQNAVEALQLSDRGYILDQGRDRLHGTGADLMNDPRVAELYLGRPTDPTPPGGSDD
ncbi:ABC transporter ATP-binding protein [Micromonospora sp. NPDC005113]